jgi:hypothetical protein
MKNKTTWYIILAAIVLVLLALGWQVDQLVVGPLVLKPPSAFAPSNSSSTLPPTAPRGIVEPPLTSASTSKQDLVIVLLPTEYDVQNLISIWRLANYPMLETTPGLQSYNITVRTSDRWLWDTKWCVVGQPQLNQNLSSLSVVFSINGVPLPRQKIRETEGTEFDNGRKAWQCHYWVTTLSGWNQDAYVRLTIDHSFANSVNDGKDTYPSGSYIQELNVSVK